MHLGSAYLVTKVEQTHCQTTQDDGKMKPAEERAFICEANFGLDANGEGDTLCSGALKKRLR